MGGVAPAEVHSGHTIGKTLDKMLDVFSNSSVLGPEGHAVVEAVVESREEHAERVAQAAKEARVKQVELLLRFQQVTGDHEGKRERVQAPGSELSAAPEPNWRVRGGTAGSAVCSATLHDRAG